MFAKKIKFEYIIIAILGLTLITIIALVTYLNYLFGQQYKKSVQNEARQIAAESKQKPSNPYLFNSTPTTMPTESITLKPVYNSSAEQTLLNKLNNRRPLSQRDLQIKASILSSISSTQSELLYSSENVTVRYSRSLDAFQGEITTTEFDLAKNEAVNWFRAKGVSLDAICNYPVYFYLNSQILKQDINISFNPLPNNCLLE